MTQNERIQAFVALEQWINDTINSENDIFRQVAHRNPWYTKENVVRQLQAIANTLSTDKLTAWLDSYPPIQTQKTVGIIAAGNIPLVAFHDVLAVLITGFKATIKLSSDDAGLSKWLLDQLLLIEPRFENYIEIVERLGHFDLIIATGSNNSSRYFDYYFGKKPHIIRRNRNSIAVIQGQESSDELTALGHDLFDYFGLGCRSVSKIYFPKDYPLSTFFEGIESFSEIRNHYKYNNNYDYNKSIYLINGDEHYDNGFLILKKDERLASPLAVVYFEYYDSLAEVEAKINSQAESLQCLVSKEPLAVTVAQFALGQSQCPNLTDYADNVDTLHFLHQYQ